MSATFCIFSCYTYSTLPLGLTVPTLSAGTNVTGVAADHHTESIAIGGENRLVQTKVT